ncbi:MAG: 30S ribosomal protein S11 [Candidatus Komeilibacteria bacterium CG11_big_fil_rev_8_21_14_0_20_36_20]|uniref:Small ribosomal subunit protein uS11 n=1 Tax=Candidatus Komeilibacteria bacterium CG11_big_fil_rev_8_21_14_0_20_36_20 TaxID=1974477 RepID=A0A2H0NC09_9BACT|nr:MAG: 30S ribosomal protein S11 [Candidatus Komeilibacteria bacterium CG11_big_fil_rev_8_21_14_0_20_36_20]PIR81997.1 MAG: 30S ribosomal protein S11 [Candidatus Komeilibacteria bacterium CG10_big_fil_rev_8_21_14_0_10_36_65]PJC55535.1 MAG: 30S ribosomal protein S11 [Candidatus Komeilibacteria bacterium CG_4_9_14_0_2_um_filter_36_13]
MKKVRSRKKVKKIIKKGQAHIQSTYNNTIITITDQQGNALSWSSAGLSGFKGAKKATPYAAGIIVRNAVEKVKDYSISEVEVFVRGVGAGREAAIRALHSNGLAVSSIKDVTPIPHNGCRSKKIRRV